MSISVFPTTRLLKILAISFLVVPLVRLSAQNSCQSGQSTISSPLANYTIPTAFLVEAYSSTEGGCDITAVRLYVDNKAVYTAPEGGSPSAGFVTNITFSQGFHNLVVVGWNNEGYAFASPGVVIFAAPTNETVYMTSPAANQTLNNTVTIAARARWDNNDITAMRAYVDNVAVYTVGNPNYNAIRFRKVFAVGRHYLVVIAWNSAGSYIKAEEYFTVQ